MPHPALDLLAAKAKLAGAVVLGGVVATAAIGGGALSLVADSSGATSAPVTCVSPTVAPSTDPSSDPSVAPSTDASAAPTDTTCPSPSASAEATESPTAEASAAAAAVEPTESAEADNANQLVLNNATVVSVDATSLVVTAAGATTTCTLSPDTHWTGGIKDPAQVLPGMVVHVRGTLAGTACTATHVVVPGKNKPHHVKADKTAKAHAKTHAKKAHGKRT